MSIAHDPSLRIPPSTLGMRLQQSREWRGFNQIDLAQAIDVSRGTISNYERGISSPSRLQVNAWAAFCDVDVEWLKDGTQPQMAPDGGGSTVELTGKLRTDILREAIVTDMRPAHLAHVA